MKDDEIAVVLQHFQPKPGAIPNLLGGGGGAAGSTKITTSTKKPKQKRNFSSISYSKETASVRLSYRHDRIVLLGFQVSCAQPYNIELVNKKRGDAEKQNCYFAIPQNSKLETALTQICSTLNNNSSVPPLQSSSLKSSLDDNTTATISQSDKEKSLFSTLSKLLLALNKLPSRTLYPARDAQQSNILRHMLSSQLSSASFSIPPPAPAVTNTSLPGLEPFDLKLLLFRYAAAGKHASTFCHPMPDEFQNCNGTNLPAEALVIASTARLCSSEFQQQRRIHGPNTTNNNNNTQPQQQRILHPQEQQVLAFLMTSLHDPSLGSHPAVASATVSSLQRTSATTRGQTLTTTLCWDLESIMGDESPRFTQLAEKYGAATAFHGTKMDNVWSILNCGFCSLSDTRFAQNGNMLGTGVYFSTSKNVASFFTTDNSAPVHPTVWRHPALAHLLGLPNIRALDDYKVSCFPIFQAKILLPSSSPPSSSSSSSMDNPNGSGGSKQTTSTTTTTTITMNGVGTGGSSTRREGTYLVVPDARDIRITKLHLTFELEKKRSFDWLLPTMLVMALAIALYYWFL